MFEWQLIEVNSNRTSQLNSKSSGDPNNPTDTNKSSENTSSSINTASHHSSINLQIESTSLTSTPKAVSSTILNPKSILPHMSLDKISLSSEKEVSVTTALSQLRPIPVSKNFDSDKYFIIAHESTSQKYNSFNPSQTALRGIYSISASLSGPERHDFIETLNSRERQALYNSLKSSPPIRTGRMNFFLKLKRPRLLYCNHH
ncbi:hypothetical protein AVEN_197236-1 [Araneus ventricosus]|uniref:Uncharacterized protein n=1 Tax=Araneus ventricosus TaxID=182803 RepID=A0A4Y2JLC2_ARAVE|nr:hypothetical protein AVEN_197236-1 [Araneus ventricosus]